MRYPYAETRKFFLSELKKEEKKWKSFITQSKTRIRVMKSDLKNNKVGKKHSKSYQDAIVDAQISILKATDELESVRRNIDSIKEL